MQRKAACESKLLFLWGNSECGMRNAEFGIESVDGAGEGKQKRGSLLSQRKR